MQRDCRTRTTCGFILKRELRKLKRDRRAVCHRDSTNARECTFELTNVGVNLRRDIRRNVIWKIELMQARLRLHDCNTSFVARLVNTRDQPSCEAAHQSLLKIWNVNRSRIRTQHDLSTKLMERVEGVEELLLRLFVLGEEVNVVNHQTITCAEPIAEISHSPSLHRFVEEIHECVAGDVAEPHFRIFQQERLANGLQQVCLAEAHTTMNEERAVRTTRLLHNSPRSSVCKLIAWSNDERIKGVVRRDHHLLIEPRWKFTTIWCCSWC